VELVDLESSEGWARGGPRKYWTTVQDGRNLQIEGKEGCWEYLLLFCLFFALSTPYKSQITAQQWASYGGRVIYTQDFWVRVNYGPVFVTLEWSCGFGIFIGHIAQGRIHFHMSNIFQCSFDVDVFSPPYV
jgi:hypothetical protein